MANQMNIIHTYKTIWFIYENSNWFSKKKTPVKCEVDNKNEITTQDFLENTSEIVDMCVVS